MLYLRRADAVAPISHNGSKHFQILSFGLPCVGISCEDRNTGNAMAQQFSSSPNVLPLSCWSSISEEALENQLHTLPLVYCILKRNALVPDKTSSFEILKDWQMFIFSPNLYDYQQMQQSKITSPNKGQYLEPGVPTIKQLTRLNVFPPVHFTQFLLLNFMERSFYYRKQ